jgi:hypothetical protein
LRVSSKYTTETKTAIQQSHDSYFFQSNVFRSIGTAFINDLTDPLTKNAIYEQLHPTFLERLINQQDVDALFRTYGTHVLTRYGMGGWIEHQITTVNTQQNLSSAARTQFEDAARVSLGSFASVKAATDLRTYVSTSLNTGNHRSFSTHNIVGGAGGIGTEDAYNAWTAAVNADNAEILLDRNLDMIGIWELLPPGNEFRALELQAEYIRQMRDADFRFLNEFVYNTTGAIRTAAVEDYATFTPNAPAEIRTPAEFRAIGNNTAALAGNYILMDDITLTSAQLLSGFTFTGRFDGNGHSITFGPISIADGLFGTNRGIIENLTVRDSSINPSITHNVNGRATRYTGIITGVNNGIIRNCRVINSNVQITSNVPRDSNGASRAVSFYIGGIVGLNGGTIEQSSFTGGSVSITSTLVNGSHNDLIAGGLVGYSVGNITDCYTNTAVSVHFNGIRHSTAHQSPRAYRHVGGLVGIAGGGRITRSFARGTASATHTILVGNYIRSHLQR